MSQQYNSIKNVDIEKILAKSETSLKEQTKQFIKQSGKMLAITIITIVSFLVTGQIIPDSLFITTFVIIPVIIFGVITWFLIDTSTKSKKELRSDLISLATSHAKLGDTLVNELISMEKKLIGRISTLESYTPFGILEIDNLGNILRTNQSFEYISGYNENGLNQLLKGIPSQLKSEQLAKILADDEDVDRLKFEFKSRLEGDIEIREYKDVYLRNKSGILFPATIRVALIQDEKRGLITQYFISDDTDHRSMLETITGQNDTINKLIGAFTKHVNEREFTDKLIKELEQSKIDIKRELT